LLGIGWPATTISQNWGEIMNIKRLIFIFLAFYFIFIGGNLYYTRFLPVRLFHHIFITIIVAIWLFRRLRDDGLPYTPLNRPLYSFIIVWFITVFTGINPRMSFEYLWFLLFHIVVFFVGVDLFQHGQQKRVMETLFIVAGVIVIVTGFEFASWYFESVYLPGKTVGLSEVIESGKWLPTSIPRASLAMQGSTHLAGFVAPLITVIIGWALTVRRTDYRKALWLLAGMLLIVLLLTSTRGGFLSFGVGIGVFLLIYASQRFDNLRQMATRVLPVVAVVAVVITLAIVAITQQRGGGAKGDSVRVDFVESAVEMFIDYPTFGVGPGNYGRAFREYRTPEIARDQYASSHNLYLNMAAETGILGLVAGLWTGGLLVKTWWQTWKMQSSRERKLRVGATIAAIIGVGAHSLVDFFVLSSIVMPFLFLLAYSVTGYRTSIDERPKGHRIPAIIGLLIVVGYGIFFFQVDRAHIAHQRSLSGGEDALELARTAADIDPGMNLYDLQIAYLLGTEVVENENAQNLDRAIEAYEHVVVLEPTWDLGWTNLAALYARKGDLETAILHLETAYSINPRTSAQLHLTRLREEAGYGNDEDIINGYLQSISIFIEQTNYLPLSDFWRNTPLRREALERYLETQSAEVKYLILIGYDTERAHELVKEDPESPVDYWVAGEYARIVENDPQKAVSLFSQAIEFSTTRGDYYVSRARAYVSLDADAAQRDLNMGRFLGVTQITANSVWAELAETEEEANRLYAESLPPRIVWQSFETVLYGRSARFELLPEMRFPGPGREAMQPWYTIAEIDRNSGDIEHSCTVYRAIMNYAPDEAEAQEWLEILQCASAPN
jgi:O-antigen ligase/tetratricopeptide (TPR) repeat protein